MLPFFSTDHLPEQRGTPAQVTDFRKFRVTRETPADAPSLARRSLGGRLGGRRAAEAEAPRAIYNPDPNPNRDRNPKPKPKPNPDPVSDPKP